MPPATIDAFRDHGKLRNSLTEDVPGAAKVMDDLAQAGISIKEVTDKLTDGRSQAVCRCVRQTAGCGGEKHAAKRIDREPTEDFPAGIACRNGKSDDRRVAVGRKDAAPVAARCHAVDRQATKPMAGLARHCRRASRAAGSAAENRERSAAARVPARPAARHGRIEFVSGSSAHDVRQDRTLPHSARARFHRSRRKSRRSSTRSTFRRRCLLFPANRAARSNPTSSNNIFSSAPSRRWASRRSGSHFIAITDPGSKMQQVAEADHFLHDFLRTSLDWRALFRAFEFRHGARGGDGIWTRRNFSTRAAEMVRACGAAWPSKKIPARCWELFWASAAKADATKLRSSLLPDISDLGAWLEQLLAESTGKVGKGIIPVDRENWRRRKFTAMIACSPTCAWNRVRTPTRTRSWRRSKRPGIRCVRISIA